jgi:hypothetical protein
MLNNVYRRSFSYTIHMIQNACNLRSKDANTSCYICHAKSKKWTKESYTYATKELPHTNSRNQTDTKFPRKRVKVAWSRGLLDLGVWWKFSFLYVVSQEMTPQFYVLSFGVEHWVLCNTYGTSVVTLKWDVGILLTKITYGVCDPNELIAIASCSHILCLGSG